MNADYNQNWNVEYQAKGIPSSFRETPSASVLWFLDNFSFLKKGPSQGLNLLDVGCGAGRNAIYFARQGFDVNAIDASDVAIERAKQVSTGIQNISFSKDDLSKGLPFEDNSFDVVTDIFVYKHQISSEARRFYRQEMVRVLKKDGLVLMSLADSEDGYYKHCPDVDVMDDGNPRTILDTGSNIESVLYSFEELQKEMSDKLKCEMMWRKHSMSEMYGEMYPRTILTTVWSRR